MSIFYRKLVGIVALFCSIGNVCSAQTSVVTNLIQDNIGIPSAIVPKLDALGAASLKNMYSLLTKEGRENALNVLSQRLVTVKNRAEKYADIFNKSKLAVENEISSLEPIVG